MPSARRIAAFAIALLLGALACAREEGPVSVAWDRTRCSHCGMLLSEPAWAAQHRDADGEVHFFDDPGCLLAATNDDPDAVAATAYFHHHHEDRWLRATEVVFVAQPGSPMGYDLGAVSAEEAPQGLTLDEARQRVRATDRARSAR